MQTETQSQALIGYSVVVYRISSRTSDHRQCQLGLPNGSDLPKRVPHFIPTNSSLYLSVSLIPPSPSAGYQTGEALFFSSFVTVALSFVPQ